MLKKIFKEMAVAQVLSAMTVILCLLIDSIMIGRFLSVDDLAAYGLANPVLLAFSAIGSMLSAGVQVLCSKAMGRGDKKGADSVFSTTFAITAFVVIIGLVIILVFRPQICTLLGAGTSGSLFNKTSSYILGFVVGAPAFMFSVVLVPFFQLAGKQSRLVFAVIVMTIGDITFDLLNVLVFNGGILGMGLASSASYYVAILVGAGYFFKKDCLYSFSLKLIKIKKLIELLKAGIPTIINMLSTVLLTYTFNQIILGISTSQESASNSVAAYSIIATVGNVCYAFCIGIAGVVLMLSSVLFTEKDKKSLHELFRMAMRYCIIVDIGITVLAVIFAPALVTLFLGGNVGAKDLAILGVRLFALSVVESAVNTAFKNYYQGTNRIKLTAAVSILQNFLGPTLSAFVLSLFFGTTGVWLGYLVGETIVILFIFIVVCYKKKTLKPSINDFTLLNSDFGVSDENCLTFSIHTPKDIVTASEMASDYCQKQGASTKLANNIAICIEELCSNAINHGFNDNKKHTMDIRLFKKENEWLIRFRDDCNAFDPISYMKKNFVNEDNNDDAHLGLPMIFFLANDVNYTNSMSLNNVSIKFEV